MIADSKGLALCSSRILTVINLSSCKLCYIILYQINKWTCRHFGNATYKEIQIIAVSLRKKLFGGFDA